MTYSKCSGDKQKNINIRNASCHIILFHIRKLYTLFKILYNIAGYDKIVYNLFGYNFSEDHKNVLQRIDKIHVNYLYHSAYAPIYANICQQCLK